MKVGQRIKRLRIANDLTQDDLAQRADLTKGFISQLERDLTSISIEAFSQILDVLGITLSRFFKEMEPGEQKIVFGLGDRVVLERDHDEETIELLIPGAQGNLMDPVLVTMEPGEASIDNGHEGEEFEMLLSGTIHLRMEGSKTVHRVRKGECFYFKLDRPHAIENKGKRTATILWIVSPPTFH